jgi:hypothetical protein
MPYQFGEYVSTYVDPQSVKISEILRNRYLDNFKANDELALAVDQMQAALPFENDVNRKKELQGEIDKTLTSLSERGDYENLGFAVHRAAKDFSKKYAPIKENYDRYQAALKDLQDRYDKKSIDAETYARSGSYITRDYKGFEMDPNTGRVKEGSMFSAPTIYNDVDVMDKLTKALAIIKPDKYDNKSNKLSVGPDGMYTVTNEFGVEQVTPEEVQKALDYVMADPDVKKAIQQKADMRTYDIQKSGAMPQTMQATIAQYGKIIEGYKKEMASKTMSASEKAQYQKAINIMQSEINSATEAAKDPTTSYNYVKSKIEQEIINPTRDLAMQYAYKNTKSSTIYEYDPIYMERRKEAMEAAKNNVPIYKNSEVTANMVGGATLSEKMQTISSLEARNRDIDIEVGPGSNLSQKQKENLLAEKRANTAKINHQKYLINEASGSSISMDDLEKQDPKIVSIFKDQMQGASPGEIYQRILTTFDNKDDQDYKDFEKIFNSKYGATALEAHLYGTGTYNYDATIGEQLNTSEVVVDKFKSVYKDKIDAKFAEIKTSSVFNYGTIQTGNAQENIAITKALDDFLLGKSISAVAIPTAYDVSAGQKITNPAILDGFVVKDYGWDPNTNTWEMILETKNPDAVNKFKTVHVDGAYLTANLPILRKLSDPTVILASVVQMEAPRGGNVNNPKIYTRDIYIEKSEVDRLTNQTYTREVPGKLTIRSVGDNNPTISFSDDLGAPIFQSANGNPSTMFRAIDDPDVQQIVGTGKIKF